MVLVTLLLAVACSMVRADACLKRCWDDYNAQIEDCVDKADMKDALKPKTMSAPAMAPMMAYEGPKVDVLEAIRSQCRANIGTSRLNSCILACTPPVIAVPVGTCEDVCRARYQPNTLGRLRCMYNC
jgi:hypothetical protein